MAKCIIIAPLYAGEALPLVTPCEGDLLLCADAGWRAAAQYGLKPHKTIGDFDSMPVDAVTGEILRLPVEKDDTDLLACIREGRRRGYSDFIAAGCLGGRMDHTLACLQCAADCAAQGESLWLLDGCNCVTVLSPGSYVFPREKGRKLGLLAYTPEVTGLTVTGARWMLNDAVLSHHYPIGCSNEWADDSVSISFAEGQLIVCISGDAAEID